MRTVHPAFDHVLQSAEDDGDHYPVHWKDESNLETSTSPSLARVLAAGCLARLDPTLSSVSVWDPAVGSGLAGFLLVEALRSAGIHVQFRGQDVRDSAVVASRERFEGVPDAKFALGNTLERDEFEGFAADLVIVDSTWGANWASSVSAVESRRSAGSFRFGVPQTSDSVWLFISLALEKLRLPTEGGGRVAALVNPRALHDVRTSAAVRRNVVEAGLLESVTRLPDGLAPNTTMPLYLLTFSNKEGEGSRGNAMIADLQTQFTTEHRQRRIFNSAISELESGLRTGKPGPRNRNISIQKFIRREAHLMRRTKEGQTLSWRIRTFNDTGIDLPFLEKRYGLDSGVTFSTEPSEICDLNPGRILQDGSQNVLKDIQAKRWQPTRLSALIETEPKLIQVKAGDVNEGQLFIPGTRDGRASVDAPDKDAIGPIFTFSVDRDRIDPRFLAAWLNSEQGIVSRRWANEASSYGQHFKVPPRDARSLIGWADELLVPAPLGEIQQGLASADERLASFQEELSSQRERIWASPQDAEAAVEKFAGVFDDSLIGWLEVLPFPVASALWTAETAQSPGDKLEAYLHAWEALVAFHATTLLSACRSDPGGSADVETAIRRTLVEQHIGIERASFGTWNVIVENTSKSLRSALGGDNDDEIARVRAAFSNLGDPAIERLLAKEVTKKFNAVGEKRNRWKGHGGHLSEEERNARVDSLVSDLRDLRRNLGNVWAQLSLVRAGSARRVNDGYIQKAEVAMGTRSPFVTKEFRVGEAMLDGELYLVRDGSPSALRLGQFVQLRAAPRDAQYTSYFYNRTDGASVRMVSYQYGPESEVDDDAERFRPEFGSLVLE